jgi:adenine-specific DNA-methyltransferase
VSIASSNEEGIQRGEGFRMSDVPTTRYQGSKRKILSWLWSHLGNFEFDSVLDAFGGSASVSFLFKKMGKRVTYNDQMKWNYLVGTALIENDHVRLSPSDIDLLCEPVNRDGAAFVSECFSGMYFTDRENLWIDVVSSRISKLYQESSCRYKTALAQYGLFQACLIKRPFNLFHRSNLPLRRAQVSRSFGNKTTWDTPFGEHLRKFLNEGSSFVFAGKHPCVAMNYDVTAIPDTTFDLVYLDPPYVRRGSSNETANYQRCYHFLEGLAQYDNWPELLDHSTPLRRIKIGEDSHWINPDKNKKVFAEVIEKFHKSKIAISYKKYGSPSVETLVRMLKRHGKKVTVRSRHYKYALNQQNGDAGLNRECLILAD